MGRDNPFQDRLDRFMAAADARDEEKLREDIERQKAEGRCDLTNLPQVSTQPFRAELEVERSPIFVSNTFKGDSWEYERQLSHPGSGEPVVQRVSVGRLHAKGRPRGVLKQIHQEVFYKLLKLWGDRGYHVSEVEIDGDLSLVGGVSLSVYELVTYLRGHDTVRDYRRVHDLLEDLASIPIVLEHEYSWQETSDKRSLKLLAYVDWHEKKVDPATRRPKPGGFSKVTIYLSPVVTDGFLKKSVKQLLLGPYEELGASGRQGRRAEVARLLYPILDHELSSKESFHCTLTALCERLGMASYRYRSKRREKFASAVRQLTGKPILGEKYELRVSLRETVDGTDYVLEARRQPCQLNLPI